METPNKIITRDDLESDESYFNPVGYLNNYIKAVQERKKTLKEKESISKADISGMGSRKRKQVNLEGIGQKKRRQVDTSKIGSGNKEEAPKVEDKSGPEASIRQMYPGAKIVKAPVSASNVTSTPSTKPTKAIAVVPIGGSRYYVYPGSGGGIKTTTSPQHPEFLHSGRTDAGTPYHAYNVRPSDEAVMTESESAAKEGRRPKKMKDKVMYYDKKIYEDDGKNAITIGDKDKKFEVSHSPKALRHFSDNLSPEGKGSLNILSGKSSHIRQHKSSQNIIKELRNEYKLFMQGKENNFLNIAEKYSNHIFKENTNTVDIDKFKEQHGKSIFGKNWNNVKNKLNRNPGIHNESHFEEWKKNHAHLDKEQLSHINDFVNQKLEKIGKSKENNLILNSKGKTIFDFNKVHPIQAIKEVGDVAEIINSKTVRDAVAIAAGSFVKTNTENEYNEVKQDMEEYLSSSPNWMINFDNNLGDFKSHLTNSLIYHARSKYGGGSMHFERGNELEKIINSYIKDKNISSKQLTFSGLLEYINSSKERRTDINRNKKDQKIKNFKTLTSISDNFKDVLGKYNGPSSLDAPMGEEGGATMGDIAQASDVQYTTSNLEGYILNCISNQPKEEALSKKQELFKDTGLNDEILLPEEEFKKLTDQGDETSINKEILLDTLDGVFDRVKSRLPKGMEGDFPNFIEEEYTKFEGALKLLSGDSEKITISDAVKAIDKLNIDKDIKETFKNGISKENIISGLGGMSPEKKSQYKEKRQLAEAISKTSNMVIDALSEVNISGKKSKDVKFEDSLGFILSHVWSPFMETFKDTGYNHIEDIDKLNNQEKISPSDILKNNNIFFNQNKDHPVKEMLKNFSKDYKGKGFYFNPEEIYNYKNNKGYEFSETENMLLKDMISNELIPHSVSKMMSKHFNKTSFTNFGKNYVKPLKYITSKVLGEMYGYMGLTKEKRLQNDFLEKMEKNVGEEDGIPTRFREISDELINQINSKVTNYSKISKIKKALKFSQELTPKVKAFIISIIHSFEYVDGIFKEIDLNGDKSTYSEKKEVLNQINTMRDGLQKKEAEIKKKKNPKVDHVLYPKTQKPRGSYPNRHKVNYTPPRLDKSKKYLPITQRKKRAFEKSTLTKIELLPDLGVSFIIGKVINDPEKRIRVQSVLFNIDSSIGKAWDLIEARNWVTDNKEKIKKAIRYSEFLETCRKFNKINTISKSSNNEDKKGDING